MKLASQALPLAILPQALGCCPFRFTVLWSSLPLLQFWVSIKPRTSHIRGKLSFTALRLQHWNLFLRQLTGLLMSLGARERFVGRGHRCHLRTILLPRILALRGAWTLPLGLAEGTLMEMKQNSHQLPPSQAHKHTLKHL